MSTNNAVPSGILNLFTKNSSCHSYNTRASASGNFYVNRADLEVYKLSFSRFGAKLWNEIPTHFQHLPKNKLNKKKTLRKLLFHILNSEDNCIDLPTLITGLPVWQSQSESGWDLFVLLLGCRMAIPVGKWVDFSVLFFSFSVSVKVLPVTPLVSGVFVHRAFCAYFLRIERVVQMRRFLWWTQ